MKQLAAKNRNSGHRRRLRERFMSGEIGSLPDYELLEMMLFYIIPRQDTKPLAKQLLKRFGSIKEVIFSDKAILATIDNAGEGVISYLRMLEDLYSRISKPCQARNETILNSWNNVLNYCNLTMGYKQQESLRIFYLDRKHRLLDETLMQQGTVDRVAIYPREIVKNCISKYATAVIIVHNHPSGEAKPSKEDITATQKVATALDSIGAILHDHIIIAKEQHYSFRVHGLI